MAREYITAVIGGEMPCVESTIRSTSIIENAKAVEEAVHAYTEKMNRKLELPTADIQTMSDIHMACVKEAIAIFLEKAVMDEDMYHQERANAGIIEKYVEFKKANETESVKKCQAVLRNLHQHIGVNIRNGEYTVPGGYTVYKGDFHKLTETYKSTDGTGIKKDNVLLEFIESKYIEAEVIWKADQNLSASEKATEIERIKAEQANKREALVRGEAKSREEEIRTIAKQMEDNIAQLRATQEQEIDNLRAHYEKVMDSRMREQARLMEEGYEKNAALIKAEVTAHRKESLLREQALREKITLREEEYQRQIQDGVGGRCSIL